MGTFDRFADTPDAIRVEGQEITIKFQRTGPNTGRISWNIPPPSNGCNAATQAYDGIVITVNNQPANYLSNSPKNGNYYNGDSTFDRDLHAGDDLDGAKVVAALYHDRTTTFIDVTDVSERTAYYVSGYAVDSVARYHREGVHAYSLPTGAESTPLVEFAAYQDITLDSINPISPTQLTGLSPTASYTLKITNNCKEYEFNIPGIQAQTYSALVNAINLAIIQQEMIYSAPLPPDANNYYTSSNGDSFFFWDGYTSRPISVIRSVEDPSLPTVPSYWLKPSTNELYQYDAIDGWVLVTNIIKSPTRPDVVECGTYWFDGATVRRWSGKRWTPLNTIISTTNPQLAPNIDCDSYWYNTNTLEFFERNSDIGRWEPVLVIALGYDPNLITTGAYWFNETTEKVSILATEWVELENITYAAPKADGSYPIVTGPVADIYWYQPDGTFLQRNSDNTEWVELSYVSYPTDPAIRDGNQLWWNTSPSIDKLFAWDEIISDWVEVTAFYQTDVDPAAPPTLPNNSAWYNPETGTITIIDKVGCTAATYIHSSVDPRNIPEGYFWFDGTTYYIFQSGDWVAISPIVNENNPSAVSDGAYWYDTDNGLLYVYDTGAWQEIQYSPTSLVPTVDTLWFETVDKVLYRWNGTTWVPGTAPIFATFIARECRTGRDVIRFSTTKVGCSQLIFVEATANSIFSALNIPIVYEDPVIGGSDPQSGPMWNQLGIGTDGSPDERRALHNDIRTALGDPVVKVELTKEQIDEAIDTSLRMLRKYSSFGYLKALFFLDLKPNQQTYTLTNQCVGFNKIVNVLNVIRARAGVFRSAYASNDAFSFAALQQLYTLGTFDMLTFHLTASYIEDLETLFASRIMYQWNESSRQIKLHQAIRSNERVLLEAILERPEQELIVDRETGHWIRRYATARCKQILSQVRGKFQSLPGPNGSTVLNASDLKMEAENEMASLMEELYDAGMQDMVNIGAKSHMVIG